MAEECEAAAEVVVAVDNLSTSEPSLPSLPSSYDMLPSNPTYKDVRPNVAIVPIFRILIGSAIGINHVVPCRASLFVSSEPMWKLQNPFMLPSSSSRHSSTPRTFPAFPGPVPPCTHALRLKLRPTEAKMDRPCRRPPPRCEGAPLSTRCGVGPTASFPDKEGGDDDEDEDDEEDEDEDNDGDDDGDDEGVDESTASLRVPVAPPTSSSAPPVGPVNTTDHPRDGCPSCPARGQYGCGAPGTAAVPGASGTEGVPSLPRSKDTQGQCSVCPPPTASWKMPPPAPPEPPAATPTAARSSSVQYPRGFGRPESAWVCDHAASPAGVPLALALVVVVVVGVVVVGVRRPLVEVEVEVAAAAAAAASRADGRR